MTTDPERAESSDVESLEDEEEKHDMIKNNRAAGNFLSVLQQRLDNRSSIEVIIFCEISLIMKVT